MTPRPSDDGDERYNGNQDRRTSTLERIAILEEWMKRGISGGASSEILRMSREIEKLETRVSNVEKKTTRWEGGGIALTAIGSALGVLIGWLASKLGLLKP